MFIIAFFVSVNDQELIFYLKIILRIASLLVNAGKDFELVVLPGQKHGYMGAARKFYQQKIWRHFVSYLR